MAGAAHPRRPSEPAMARWAAGNFNSVPASACADRPPRLHSHPSLGPQSERRPLLGQADVLRPVEQEMAVFIHRSLWSLRGLRRARYRSVATWASQRPQGLFQPLWLNGRLVVYESP